MFGETLLASARQTLAEARARGLRLVTAESCTGGLIAALLTEIPGSSDVVERGFVTYSNEAKEDLLGVSGDLIRQYGAVSEPVARAMAEGALKHSLAQVAVAVTGIAGPGGGTPKNRWGWFMSRRCGWPCRHHQGIAPGRYRPRRSPEQDRGRGPDPFAHPARLATAHALNCAARATKASVIFNSTFSKALLAAACNSGLRNSNVMEKSMRQFSPSGVKCQ